MQVGRMYSEKPSLSGIQSRSMRRSSLIHSSMSEPLKQGKASRWHESLKRFMFRSGRNRRMLPLLSLYAFILRNNAFKLIGANFENPRMCRVPTVSTTWHKAQANDSKLYSKPTLQSIELRSVTQVQLGPVTEGGVEKWKGLQSRWWHSTRFRACDLWNTFRTAEICPSQASLCDLSLSKPAEWRSGYLKSPAFISHIPGSLRDQNVQSKRT